jgi:putative tryptophan/tyrosine transport system substrate-binding protein
MERREFIVLLGGAATALPLTAHAQRPARPLIGFLGMYSGETGARREQMRETSVDRFREGLKAAGYVEGQNVEIDYRWANWQPAQVAGTIADLLRRQAAVIVSAGGPEPAIVAKRVTSTVPIVFVFGGDPIELGLVASLNRPGGNVTGVVYTGIELGGKRLDLLTQLVPQAKTIAFLSSGPSARGIGAQKSDMRAAAASAGKEMIVFDIHRDSDIDAAFSTLVERGGGALAVGIGATLRSNLDRIVALAALHMIPAIYPFRDYVLGGGLMSYGGRTADAYRPAGVYVARILNGEKPADLPVQQSTLFELVINLKTAKALGLAVPRTLLAATDEVIE